MTTQIVHIPAGRRITFRFTNINIRVATFTLVFVFDWECRSYFFSDPRIHDVYFPTCESQNFVNDFLFLQTIWNFDEDFLSGFFKQPWWYDGLKSWSINPLSTGRLFYKVKICKFSFKIQMAITLN